MELPTDGVYATSRPTSTECLCIVPIVLEGFTNICTRCHKTVPKNIMIGVVKRLITPMRTCTCIAAKTDSDMSVCMGCKLPICTYIIAARGIDTSC